MEVDLFAMHADIGNGPAGPTISSQSSKVAGMPTASMAVSTPGPGEFHDRVRRLAVGAVDHRRRAEALGDFKPIVVEIDHDDLATARRTAR